MNEGPAALSSYCCAHGFALRERHFRANQDGLTLSRTFAPICARRDSRTGVSPHPVAVGVAAAAAALTISALLNHLIVKKAERDNPPSGKFVDVGGIRLHYVEPVREKR